MIITAFAHLANSSEWQWYDVMTFITDISVSGDLSQCQLGSRWRSWLSDLFVASIQMTEFLHNNDDCHSSRDMRHPTVGIIVYSKIVWSHLAWRPCMFGLYTQHIRGVEWNHFVGCLSVYAAWEPRDAWLVHCGSEFWVSPAGLCWGHQPAARLVNLNTEMRWWADGRVGPTLLTSCTSLIWISRFEDSHFGFGA